MFNTAPDFTRTAIAALGTILFAGACLVGAAGPAAAAESAARTQTIAYGDLNLAKPSGRSALDARIASAAHSVCHNGGRDVASQQAYNRCVKAAVSSARSQADAVTAS